MSALITLVFTAKYRSGHARPPWRLTLGCCIYFGILCVLLLKVVPIYATLFEGLSVELPFPTDVLIATYRWSLPLFYLFAIAVAVVRQFLSIRGIRLRLANFTLIFAGILVPPLVILCMYLPLFVLTHKLHQMK